MPVKRHYGTDLTEKQWQIIEKLLPKQKMGRKRHIMVVVVHAACIQDYDGARLVLSAVGNRLRLKVIFADSAYEKVGLN